MNFRKFMVSSGMLVLAGRNAESNEELIKQAGKRELVFHTSQPGSPFVNIKGDPAVLDKREIKEAAVFCAAFSQAWKKAKKKPGKIEVHYFLRRDIFKLPGMKTGTFGVKKAKKIIVKREEIEMFTR